MLFDFRNVPLNEQGAGLQERQDAGPRRDAPVDVQHGIAQSHGDAPRAVVEGIALYGETRPLHGHGEPGQINGTRLDDLAHIQRREKWISATDLLTDDTAAFGTTLDHTLLAYAQGWLLVYYLMKTPARLPQFQAYLKTIYTRTDKNHRYDDAEKHFGDLDRLDQELRREAIRLQRDSATVIDLAPGTHAERPCPPPRHDRAGVFRRRTRRAGPPGLSRRAAR